MDKVIILIYYYWILFYVMRIDCTEIVSVFDGTTRHYRTVLYYWFRKIITYKNSCNSLSIVIIIYIQQASGCTRWKMLKLELTFSAVFSAIKILLSCWASAFRGSTFAYKTNKENSNILFHSGVIWVTECNMKNRHSLINLIKINNTR